MNSERIFPFFITTAFVCLSLRCCIFLDFQVYFEGKRAYNTSFQHNHEIVLDETSRSTEISVEKLKPGTQYSVYVKAKTAKGYGAKSDSAVVETPSKRMWKCFVCWCEHVGTVVQLVEHWPSASMPCAPFVLNLTGMNFSLIIRMGSASNSLNLRVVDKEGEKQS